ncbi:P-loop containing nucleoside triphosphate hydrolase protein [Mycena belliarum]|uniref:P-loop containing nucleoside triphosphate hydrolase protein n=1 Tax=Mycena belliarum TaxID=1033014 RepID=A0AAD6XN56_9AGAR|nr:P-loop containing nucleoside triphosphate hydrolase protein [Mycena belliae]
MDLIAQELASDLVDKLWQTPLDSRLIVGIAGSPAAGKSSFCQRLLRNINSILENDSSARHSAILVGLDGWHLTRAELSLFPDPELAHERRGIHWTFDGKGYVAFIHALRLPVSPSSFKTSSVDDHVQVITAPAFSHALKDPTPDAVSIHPYNRLVLIEGLYTFLSIPPWSEAAVLLDERWFLRVDEAEACRRLVLRHVETGICPDEETARLRAEGNDLPNARFVVENMMQPTRFIESVNDPEIARELDS